MKEYNENQIDDYLLGRMLPAETLDFENKLGMDKEFAQQVEARKKIIRYVDVLGDAALKERVSRLHEQAVKDLPKRQATRLPIIRYAAAVLLLLIATYFVFRWYAPPQDLYLAYYQAYELNVDNRAGGTQNEQLALVGRLYADGQYKDVLVQLESLPDSLHNTKITLARGISYLETAQYEAAIPVFQILIDAKDPIYEEHARWYQALAYLKVDDIKTAKKLFRQIADQDRSFKQSEAKEILMQLD